MPTGPMSEVGTWRSGERAAIDGTVQLMERDIIRMAPSHSCIDVPLPTGFRLWTAIALVVETFYR